MHSESSLPKQAGEIHLVAVQSPATGNERLAARAAQRRSGALTTLLAADLSELWHLIAALVDLDVAYRAHAAALFIGHPAVRLYLLGLCALADRDDHVAEAGVLRAPFFAVDCEDLAVALVQKDAAADVRRRRVSEARDILQRLRQQRHRLPAAAVARRLIEATTLTDALQALPNAPQHIAAVHAVRRWIEAYAWRNDLDFDSLAGRLRAMLAAPDSMDMPLELSSSAVQILPTATRIELSREALILWPVLRRVEDVEAWSFDVTPDGGVVVQRRDAPARVHARATVHLAIVGSALELRDAIHARLPKDAGVPVILDEA